MERVRSFFQSKAREQRPPARVKRRQFRSLVDELERNDDPCAGNELDVVSQYEVEFPVPTSGRSEPLGIDLETDFYGNHAVIKCVRDGSSAVGLPKCYLKPGHVVVAVNGIDLSSASFQEVIHTIRSTDPPIVLRFLDPEVQSLDRLHHERVLANRDAYGFAKDEQYILSHRRRMRRSKDIDAQLEADWLAFIRRWGGLDRIDALLHGMTFDSPPREGNELEELSYASSLRVKLRELVLRGIPPMLRSEVWAVLANVRKYKSRFPDDYYSTLRAQSVPFVTVEDIEKDVGRTYPEHEFFRTERGKSDLRALLIAYAAHNSEIGYCQGVNFIAGMLLLFADIERAFWLLCVLLQDSEYNNDSDHRFLPAANYSRSMTGAQTDQLVFRSLVRVKLPEVTSKMEALGLHIELFTLQWFICAFVCTLPTTTALRVWDWLFLDGQEVLFITAIGILKIEEPRILGASGISEMHCVVKTLGTDLHDDDDLMAFLQKTSIAVENHDENMSLDSSFTGSFNGSRLSSQTRRKPEVRTHSIRQAHTLHDIDQLRAEFRMKLGQMSFATVRSTT